jgi:ankyrin repeat protein
MLRSLLFQLLDQEPRLYPAYRPYYRRLQDMSSAATVWSYEDLKSLFTSFVTFLKSNSRAFWMRPILLILDAMDEADESDAGTKRLDVLSMLASLCLDKQTPIQSIVSSRPVNQITAKLKGSTTIILQESNRSDIELIVDSRLPILTEAMEDDETSDDPIHHNSSGTRDIDFVREYIIENARGIILWVVVILRELEILACSDGMSPMKLRAKLLSLPMKLQQVYEDIIQRMVEKHSQEHISEGQCMLNWVGFAKRPLRLEEFRDCLAISGPNDTHTLAQQDYLSDRRAYTFRLLQQGIINKCGGLLEIRRQTVHVKPTDVVQFTHQTVKAFLLTRSETNTSYALVESHANQRISLACVDYLELCIPPADLDPRYGMDTRIWSERDYREYVALLNDRPLLSYVLSFLSDHCRAKALETTIAALENLLRRRGRSASFMWGFLETWLEQFSNSAEWASRTILKSDDSSNFRATCLITAAQLGYEHTTQALLCAGANVDRVVLGYGKSALEASAATNHHSIVRLVTQHTRWPDRGNNALVAAVISNNLDTLLLLLLQGATADARDGHGESALHIAAKLKDREVFISALVEAGADINGRGDGPYAWAPLHWAAAKGLTGTVKRLLDLNADIEKDGSSEGQLYETPLLVASSYGQEEVAQLLLEHGADANPKGSSRETPLHHAAWLGRIKLAKMLLERGADVDWWNWFGQSSLHLAVHPHPTTECPPEVMTRLLLEKDALVNVPDHNGRSALNLAAASGNIACVRLLLRYGADVHFSGFRLNGHGTALHEALRGEHMEVMKLLLQNGSDPFEVSDTMPTSAMDLAVEGGNEAAVKLFNEYTARK